MLKRDNYTCQKCGRFRNNSKSTAVDVYGWEENVRLIEPEQVKDNVGRDPERYITWCKECSRMENIEHFKVLQTDCPIHHDEVDGYYDTGCSEKIHDTKIAIWLNGFDLSNLKTIAHCEKTTCRDLLTEAMHDLFVKHGLIVTEEGVFY